MSLHGDPVSGGTMTTPPTPSTLPVFTNEKTETRIMSRKLGERVPSLGQAQTPTPCCLGRC